MNVSKSIVVVCEGASEWIYLQRLNSALARLPFPDGWCDVPVRFIGRPKRTGVGSGAFHDVERALRKEQGSNRSATVWSWVDADIYVRNDRECGERYRRRADSTQAFRFSVLNFEDFLALHLDDAGFARWVKAMSDGGHFSRPLHWNDYKALFELVIPGYRKGELPADFITLGSLGNLKRHLERMPEMSLNGLKVDRTFAESMLDELSRWYEVPEAR